MQCFNLPQRKQDGWAVIDVVLEHEWFISKLTTFDQHVEYRLKLSKTIVIF